MSVYLRVPASIFLASAMMSFQSCAGAVEPAIPVTVLPASRALTVAPPGGKVNVATNFIARSHISEDYSMVLSLIDSKGDVVDFSENNLKNQLTALPTSLWTGPVSITTAINVPHAADGDYKLVVSLNSPAGAAGLTAGPGVIADKRNRYAIGSLRIQRSAPAPAYLPTASLDLSGYKLTFDDEFLSLSISDSEKFNGSRWYTQNEVCCMTTSDGAKGIMAGLHSPYNPFSLIPGGGLNIRLQRDGNMWYSGVITSVDNSGIGFSQKYGYFEMKAKFPPGLDTWPAFWLLNTAAKQGHDPAGEIDIVEYIANPGFPNYIMTTLHDWSNGSAPGMSHHMVTLPTDGFHTYGMLWTETTMTFYFDGAVTFECPTPAIMHQPYYLLVDLGVGGYWPTDKTPHINDMQVKYVRAYSK